MWSPADIADAVEQGLRRRSAQLDLEQAVTGIDALDELQLHPLIAQALREAGYGVHREQRYPSDRRHRRMSEGERCDLVLTPDARPLAAPDVEPGLFTPGDAVELSDAYWIEIKTVAQYTCEGPNYTYSGQLLSTVKHDVAKLSREDEILHAALLLIMFTADQEIADHDFREWQRRCLERGLPIAAPYVRRIEINNRHGHALCTAALCPVMHL